MSDLLDTPETRAYKTRAYKARDGTLLSIALNRPQVLRALAPALLTELRTPLTLAADNAVQTVLLTGEGRGICSRADLAFTPLEGDAANVLATLYNPVVRVLAGRRRLVFYGG